MTALSIIIPVYNVGIYLKECLDSILLQQHDDVEIILVNDGSTDNSGEICEEYAREYAEISVFHQENGGVSNARNLGLEKARGEWVSFVDPDDFVGPDYCSFFRSVKGKNYDLVFFSLSIFSKKGGLAEKKMEDKFYADSLSMQEGIITLMRNPDNCEYFGFTVNKFFRQDLIKKNHIRFVENLTYREDELFTLDYCRYISHFFTSSKVLYHYRIDVAGSLSHREKPIGEIIKYYDCFMQKTAHFTYSPLLAMEYDRALHLLVNAYKPELSRTDIQKIHLRVSELVKKQKKYLANLKKTRVFRMIYSFPSAISFPLMEKVYQKIYQENRKKKETEINNYLW